MDADGSFTKLWPSVDEFSFWQFFFFQFLCWWNFHSIAVIPSQHFTHFLAFLLCVDVIFTALRWVLMISPRVNVWVTTIIWRYNIHSSTSSTYIQIYVAKKKRTCGCFGLSIVCGRAFSTQYISLFNQFFDQITLRNYIYSITTTKISPQVAPDWFPENISRI